MSKAPDDLKSIARHAMLERGLLPDFSNAVQREINAISGPAAEEGPAIRDLRDRLWASIDNDDSRDLDQLSVAEPLAGDTVRILIAIADVDAIVKRGSAVDAHARTNTTSVYTAAGVFSMLPEKLSTDLTSLGEQEERLAIVMDMTVDAAAGAVREYDIYRAIVTNHAKLAYDSVAAWLDGTGAMPDRLAAVPGIDSQLRIQDRVAQSLRKVRHAQGALDLDTIEVHAVFEDGRLSNMVRDRKNRARELIEDFMIAANGVTAKFLDRMRLPSLRRILRVPKRWDRIVELAASFGEELPAEPNAAALDQFLAKRRQVDPERFCDLSLAVVKLLGKGEYVPELPGQRVPGHFGLAVNDYTHSTAPNRRFPDLITQRLVKAGLGQGPLPYGNDELTMLASHCTLQEDNANKVERQVRKSAAAILLAPRIGAHFDGIVTGASIKGTWVRLTEPVVEGRVVRGFEGLDVGDRVRVQLVHTDAARGFIDFIRSS